MDALEFYKSHESAPLPDIGDLVSLTVEELCELMEQYHQSKVNNGVLDDVIVSQNYHCYNCQSKNIKTTKYKCRDCKYEGRKG